MEWRNEFTAHGEGSTVTVHINFHSDADIKNLLEMGFEGGFSSALNNLDHYLSEGFRLRKENTTSTGCSPTRITSPEL